MQSIMNSVRLIGNVGMDPIVTQLENGSKVVKWRMATTERLKNGNGDVKENTQWHQLIAWGNLASIVEKYVVKGSKLAVEGKLNHRRYVSKDGQNREATEIVVKDIMFVGKKSDRSLAEDTEEFSD